MLTVNHDDLQSILAAFGINDEITAAEELLRYNYEEHDPAAKDVRLMIRCCFSDAAPVVVKLKHESDVTEESLTEQICFSEHLLQCGIPTAHFHLAGGGWVLSKSVNGYDLLITVEDYKQGELKTVTPDIAEKTGSLLAETHNIAERDDLHVHMPVLFDPFSRNDLFSHEAFEEMKDNFTGEDARCFSAIEDLYCQHMQALSPLRERRRYAVQGDISDCNLFMTADGKLGMFDFNRSGDNILFCDAIMQAVFESRLMDYEQELTETFSDRIFQCFLRGYHRIRSFSDEEMRMIPHLCAIINTFWLSDLVYAEDSLTNLLKTGDKEKAGLALQTMKQRITKSLSLNL